VWCNLFYGKVIQELVCIPCNATQSQYGKGHVKQWNSHPDWPDHINNSRSNDDLIMCNDFVWMIICNGNISSSQRTQLKTSCPFMHSCVWMYVRICESVEWSVANLLSYYYHAFLLWPLRELLGAKEHTSVLTNQLTSSIAWLTQLFSLEMHYKNSRCISVLCLCFAECISGCLSACMPMSANARDFNYLWITYFVQDHMWWIFTKFLSMMDCRLPSAKLTVV